MAIFLVILHKNTNAYTMSLHIVKKYFSISHFLISIALMFFFLSFNRDQKIFNYTTLPTL